MNVIYILGKQGCGKSKVVDALLHGLARMGDNPSIIRNIGPLNTVRNTIEREGLDAVIVEEATPAQLEALAECEGLKTVYVVTNSIPENWS